MMQFFAMGGYAAFVWPAYGITALGLGGAVLLSVRAYFRAKRMYTNLGDRSPE